MFGSMRQRRPKDRRSAEILGLLQIRTLRAIPFLVVKRIRSNVVCPNVD